MNTLNTFRKVINEETDKFRQIDFLKILDDKKIRIEDYHNILIKIFHQVAESSCGFSIAAGHLTIERSIARQYLMKHAEEEKTHWEWILNDLEKTGYFGKSPTEMRPCSDAAAYISFNYYIAHRMPLARLGIASMLESLGANLAKEYGKKLADTLGLKADQMVFYLGHSDTDIGHTAEIFRILELASPSEKEWSELVWAAQTAGALYRNLYTLKL